nr:MAG TPA: ferredoxin-thioredoxin reductase [Caudoviricetes sp.]
MVIMKVGDLVRVSPFVQKDSANQKGKVGEVVEIINNNGLEIVKVRFSNDCYGLYDGEVLQLIKNDKKQKQ